MIWVGIIILAKDKIKEKIKKIIKSKSNEYRPSDLLVNIQHEYNNLENTLNMNIISIKDDINSKKLNKINIKKDIIELNLEKDEEVNMYEMFQKTVKILKKIVRDLLNKLIDLLN